MDKLLKTSFVISVLLMGLLITNQKANALSVAWKSEANTSGFIGPGKHAVVKIKETGLEITLSNHGRFEWLDRKEKGGKFDFASEEKKVMFSNGTIDPNPPYNSTYELTCIDTEGLLETGTGKAPISGSVYGHVAYDGSDFEWVATVGGYMSEPFLYIEGQPVSLGNFEFQPAPTPEGMPEPYLIIDWDTGTFEMLNYEYLHADNLWLEDELTGERSDIIMQSVETGSFVFQEPAAPKITYVDATDGEAGNTSLATGEVFTSVDVGTSGSGADGLWRWREFANSATIFESGGDWAGDGNTEDCPRLVTLVEVPEGDYNVYAYFWADGDQWRIQASLTDSEGDLPLFIANDPGSEATVADGSDFAEPVPMLTEDNRTLWQAYLGTTGLTTAINVYIDDDPVHLNSAARTWYDGIGYEAVSAPEPEEINYHPGHIIVKIEGEADLNHVEDVMNELGAVKIDTFSLIDAELWDISGGSYSVAEAVAAYADDPSWVYFEPDYIDQFYTTPNDPDYPTKLWGLTRICAEQEWDYETGDDVIIAVIDSGVDYTHPDLAANMWINPGETLNGLDDDGNGYVDDIYGCDCGDSDGDPMDEYYHGTHVAGIVAACGNNGIGITGVSWHAKIMALKVCDVNLKQYKSYKIKAIEYALDKGAKLSNNSWGSYTYSQALYDAIRIAGAKGHLFVAAAGNNGTDNDGTKPAYPASHDLDNIISVTATNQFDNLFWFSNYGPSSVDLAAPGIGIYSTFPTYMTSTMSNKGFSTDYGYRSGTSQAAPYVTGAASLIWSRFPTLNNLQVKDQILNTVEPLPSLAGKTVTGGILSFCQGQVDCNGNGVPDWQDILNGTSEDRNGNSIPDECEISVDPGTNGLIAYYAMENSVSDSSGNGFNGTIYGNPNFVAGHDGMALDLDGNGDYVDCGYDPLFDVTTNEITVSAWVTIRSIANQWAAIAAKGEYAWRLGNASWDPRFHFGITIWSAPDISNLDGVTAVGYDEWHHAAGVFDGSNIMIYLDGALDVSAATTEPIGVNNANMLIGDNPDSPGRYWDGLIDELMIYNRALSKNEILYLAGN
jgi:subtilisin family serine protease